MGFQCPNCSNKRSLQIVARIELPPDVRSDEIALQILDCSYCEFKGVAVYEESRRGALGSESYDHYGFTLPKTEISKLKANIKRCPRPTNPRCSCRAHRELSRKDEGGRWIRPGFIEALEIFPMRL
jgi:hypothetical protein